ncbi:MAG: hypothetical protein ACRDPD_11000 [Streptosporangiaceae bacterium]
MRAGRSQPQSLSVIGMPAETRILDPMAELIVDDWDLVGHLTVGEKIWGFHGDIRIRLFSIVSVAPGPPHWPTPPDVTPRSH